MLTAGTCRMPVFPLSRLRAAFPLARVRFAFSLSRLGEVGGEGFPVPRQLHEFRRSIQCLPRLKT